MSPRTHGIIYAQLNALCAGATMAIGKEVLAEIPAHVFVALMYAIVAPINTAWWLLTRLGLVGKLHAADSGFGRHPLEMKGIAWMLAHTTASCTGIVWLWEGLARANAAAGSLMIRIEVVVAIILGLWLLKERFTRWHWLGFALIAAGMVLVRWGEFSAEPEAFTFLLASAVSYGVAEFTGKVAVTYWPVPRLMVVRGWLMLAVMLVLWRVATPGWHPLTQMGWFWLVVCALMGPLFARNFYMLSLSYLPVSQVVLLNQAQPLYAALVGFAMRHEIPAPLFYAGAAAIIVGNVVLIRMRGHRLQGQATS